MKLLSHLNDPVFSRRCLGILVLLLLAWCTFTTLLLHHSYEAVISSTRIAVETGMVLLLLRFGHRRVPEILMIGIVGLAALNGIIVIFQLLEGSGCIATPFSRIITDFWALPVDEFTRKPGLFNGVQTSSLISFFALVLLARRKDAVALVAMTLCLFPLIFGARTFLIFVPVILLLNIRLLLSGAAALCLFGLLGSSCGMLDLLQKHIEERVVPTAMVIASANPQLDYSTKDLVTQYKEPDRLSVWLVGNGEPRYSEKGGKDPALSRWLLQTGLPGALLIGLISGFICLLILMRADIPNAVFALALALATFKGELMTSTLIFTMLALYALSGASLPYRPRVAVLSNAA